jgi:beta-phosphoglucomutase family hydrolase
MDKQGLRWALPAGCRGLIFDCDGTLVDSMPLHYEAWIAVLSRHGLSFSEKQFYAWAGTPVAEIVRRLAAEQGREVAPYAIADERDNYFHSLPISRLRPVESVVAIARRHHGELPMAVATGSTLKSAAASLTAIGVLHLFDLIVSAEDVAAPKPAPDAFLLAAQRLGVRPAECVVFEDADAGLTAGLAAGMKVVDIRRWASEPQVLQDDLDRLHGGFRIDD